MKKNDKSDMNKSQPANGAEKATSQSGKAAFVRFYWMCLGNALLFVFFCIILNKPEVFPSFADAGVWLSAITLVLARYADIRFLGGKNGTGKEPSTMADWRKYSATVLGATAALWLLLRMAF